MAEVKIYTHIYNSNYWDLITFTTEKLTSMCRETDCPLPLSSCPFGEDIDCQDVTERDWLNLIGAKGEQIGNFR